MSMHRRHLLSSLAALACPVWAPAAPAVVMAARDGSPGMDPRGWLVSEKLDGVRAVWDGSRLRFRSGREIAAPAWFTRGLPATALDGELWLGRGRFDDLSGTVRRQVPDDAAWRGVRYALFDQPGSTLNFAQRAAWLSRWAAVAALPHVLAVPQFELPHAAALRQRLQSVVRAGGEGLMLHRADAMWMPGRSDALRKLKPQQDAEAVVIGHEPGKGRHQGRLGALVVQLPDGRALRLGTGFSDAEREDPPTLGQTVTFTYRGLTETGLPRFASFLRVRDEG
jgi:DNA ligase-1